MKHVIASIFFILVLSAFVSANTPKVHVIKIDGAINPASADYISESIQDAVEANAECLIIQLNTPGGLLKSTRVIVSDLLNAKIPVIVYVSPSGSQSASAGVFVTLAAHVAVMAPGTNIGAAHPVTVGEQMDSIMSEKATNDAAAFIRTISEKRHRNIEWAEDAVRKSYSITETEALQKNVIDTIAASVRELLQVIDGIEVELPSGKHVLTIKDASIETFEKSFRQKILDLLSDPNIAYILMLLGMYGLLFELYNPGSIFPGVVGAICLVLAFYSFHTLPINYAGIALIIISIVLFILEIKIISHGLLTIGGIVSLALGSLMLIETDSTLEFVSISWEVILASVVSTAAFFLFAIGLGIKAQRLKPTTGSEGLVGELGEAITELSPEGNIRVHGEIWSASSIEGKIANGSRVQVQEVNGLHLKVKSLRVVDNSIII
ncbi:MAG: nodulation protein NfeD [Ignavibacteriae bacterium]|nr:nodulation protein NfeD [Ignavibacteriota bacterium]